jgi:hypothetical protein
MLGQLGLFELLGEPSKGQLNYWVLICTGDPADAPFSLPDLNVSLAYIPLCFSYRGFVVRRGDLTDANKTLVPAYDIHPVIHLRVSPTNGMMSHGRLPRKREPAGCR